MDEKIVVHCWKGKVEWAKETFGAYSEKYCDVLAEPGATCMLLDGHEGPHEFTPDANIKVTFR